MEVIKGEFFSFAAKSSDSIRCHEDDGVWLGRAQWKPLGRYAGHAQGREKKPGWAGREGFGPWPIGKNEKGFLFFKSFLNSKPI
jgi:hypothetical protein